MSGETKGTASRDCSTDSGHGSEPLSDAFVAVAAGGRSNKDSVARVEAPRSSDRLFIRRSTRVASSRAHSTQASTSHPSATSREIVDALPGGKRKAGYAYEVLEPVAEEPGPTIRPVMPAGNASSFWDMASPQLGRSASRKRSATSAAPSIGRGPTSKRLASAADFSPAHFEEPVSDGPVPPLSAPHLSVRQHSNLPSTSMQVLEVPQDAGGSCNLVTPVSSPISQNPLLRRGPGTPMDVQMPSPQRIDFRTQDSNAAWAAAEGLFPIPEGFVAPGYVPANVVGGINYIVRSPRSPRARTPQARQPSNQPAGVGRQLFAEYMGMGIQDGEEQRIENQGDDLPQQSVLRPRATSLLPQQIALQEIDPPQRLSSQARLLQQQQATSQGVRLFHNTHYMRIY